MSSRAKEATPQKTHQQTVCCPNCKTSFSVVVTTPALVRGHELTRRAKLIIETAQRGTFGRPICPYCNKLKRSRLSLIDHIREQHSVELQDERFFKGGNRAC